DSTNIAPNIIMTNMPKGFYKFSFNDASRVYSVEAVRLCEYSNLTVAGDFTSWSMTPNMMLIGNNTWQGEFYFNTASNRFKIMHNNWSVQWGKSNQPPPFTLPITGRADKVDTGYDITITGTSTGFYQFTFNDSNLNYQVKLLFTSASGINLLGNPSFESAGSASYEAYEWQYGNPDGHGGKWSTANRANWGGHSYSYHGAIQSGSGGGVNGGWWQEGPASPGRTYQASGWFYTDVNPPYGPWTAVVQGIKIEFYTNTIKIKEFSTNFADIGEYWTKKSMKAVAPDGANWARMVAYADNIGTKGAMRVDDTILRTVATRTQDFNDWGLYTNDGCHDWDWLLCQGKVVTNDPVVVPTSDIFISEYVEGSANNKAIEIFNGRTNAIDLAAGQYYLQGYFNGGTTAQSLALTGIIDSESTYIIAHPSATNTITNLAQQTSSSVINFNGDDTIILRSGGTNGPIVDRFGQIGFDPGSSWGGGITVDHTLRRKPTVLQGDTNAYGVFDPTLEWDVYPMNDFSGLGSHIVSSSDSPFVPTFYSASIATGMNNYIQSGEIDGGIGSVSFWYRAVSNSPAMDYVVQTSPDGSSWSYAGEIKGIANTTYQYYVQYIYQPEHRYFRILHTNGTNRLLVDDIHIAEPTTLKRSENFESWTDPGYATDGTHELVQWMINDGHIGTAGSRDARSAWILTNGYVRTPWFAYGVGVINFWYHSQLANAPIDFSIQYSTDSNTWNTLAVKTTSSTNFTFGTIYAYITNAAFVRLHYDVNTNYTSLNPYLVLDDIEVEEPFLYRSQNFDEWPSQGYADSDFRGWHVQQAVIDNTYAYYGKVARLINTISRHAYVQSPEIPSGLGNISFVYRKWSPTDASPTYELQRSSNGVDWVNMETLVISNGVS
ncbi:MAG: lamin tail domain-containing protein, partial [Lentisphaerota bacterium]